MKLSPAEAAKRLQTTRDRIMAFIRAGELTAYDERTPNAKRPRYRIEEEDLWAWQRARLVKASVEVEPRTQPKLMIQGKGLLARRRERKRSRVAAQKAEGGGQ